MRHHGPGHQVDAAHVDGHHPVEELGLGLEDVAHAGDSGVVEEHVDPAELLDYPLREVGSVPRACHVDPLRDRRVADPGHSLSGRVEINVGDDDPRALLGEQAGARLADP